MRGADADREALLDLLEHIDKIDRHTTEGRAALDDEVTQAAVLRWLGIMGEAAGRLSPELRTGHDEVPWRLMVAMRNHLVHAYHDVDLDVVWETVTQLPALRGRIRSLLDELPE